MCLILYVLHLFLFTKIIINFHYRFYTNKLIKCIFNSITHYDLWVLMSGWTFSERPCCLEWKQMNKMVTCSSYIVLTNCYHIHLSGETIFLSHHLIRQIEQQVTMFYNQKNLTSQFIINERSVSKLWPLCERRSRTKRRAEIWERWTHGERTVDAQWANSERMMSEQSTHDDEQWTHDEQTISGR